MFEILEHLPYKGTGLSGSNQYYARINVLAQGHNTMTLVRLKPTVPRSRVKHSTTEPLRSYFFFFNWPYLLHCETYSSSGSSFFSTKDWRVASSRVLAVFTSENTYKSCHNGRELSG